MERFNRDAASLASVGFGILLTILVGCQGDIGEGGSAGAGPESKEEVEACESARSYFESDAWVQVMGKICIDCHTPGGIAPAQGADFELQPPGYPGFLDTNFDEVRRVSKIEADGTSQLLLKPLGGLNHGGGQVLTEDAEEYQVLVALLENMDSLSECTTTPPAPTLAGVTLLGPVATLRKASLHLAGRLPTPEETQRVVEEGEKGLSEVLWAMMKEDAFFDRLKELYNDVFLTDRYLAYNGFSINILNDDDFPVASDYYDNLPDDVRRSVSRTVAREPLEFIAYLVKNDRPFTEILTANFTVVNGESAQVYNIDPPGSDYGDPNAYREAQIRVVRDGGMLTYPHAGILTSPMFLNRFPTTPTNRNRHRARKIFEFFLATDILKIAERPIDPTQSARYINPTRDDPSCNQCHRQIDPIAGAFMKFNERDQERYFPDQEWFPEVFPPGYGDEIMQVDDFPYALQWLAQRIVADPRFPLSVVYTLYRALTGHQPIEYPSDRSVEDYTERLAAWQAQNATFRSISAHFIEREYNLKVAIRDIILSPYYRAVGVEEGAEIASLIDVGTGRLSTPELLGRKIQATVGIPWTRNRDSNPYLDSDYEILYGGIDSDTLVDRLTVPNGLMAGVQWRMANEVACAATAWDFWLPVDQRHLFRHVTVEDTPENAEGAIRENIRYLHAQLLGEDLEADDPELDRTYRLFADTWSEGTGKLEDESLSNRVTYACQARYNWNTGEDIPDDQRLSLDENYVIRSWMAVVTYLLADFKFIYE